MLLFLFIIWNIFLFLLLLLFFLAGVVVVIVDIQLIVSIELFGVGVILISTVVRAVFILFLLVVGDVVIIFVAVIVSPEITHNLSVRKYY